MSHKKQAVIVFFVVPNDKRKWLQSPQRENLRSMGQTPFIFSKHTINSYVVILHKYHLADVQREAAKYNITMYQEFMEYSKSKKAKMAYHIKHYHDLSTTYEIPKKVTPQGWGNMDKINDIHQNIQSENSGLRRYYDKYNITSVKLLSVFGDYLSFLKDGTKLFEVRPNWKGIPLGSIENIPIIFKQSGMKKNMIYNAINHSNNPYHQKMDKNKIKKRKKQLKKQNNIRHINNFIKQANDWIKSQLSDNIKLYDLQMNNEQYKYYAKYAEEKWNINWNDFIVGKQIIGGKQYQKNVELKSLDEVHRIFITQKANNS